VKAARDSAGVRRSAKRKQLAAKAAPGALAPYSLTEKGRAVLAEMTLREAA
jgi:hypothetical protein